MKEYKVTEYGVKPDSRSLQTVEFQRIFDMCKENGGVVVVPKGRYYLSAVRMWSNTTLYLQKGAQLYGSDECDDYEVFPIPEGMEMRSDMEVITQYYVTPWETYRRAVLTAYGEKNISVIGEPCSVIDGQKCYDENGEEHYRGPHGIFFSCCENVLLEGYTIRHCGNFAHEINNCRDVTVRKVTCLGGSDGLHLHCTQRALIEECVFKTGDDCIAGMNMKDVRVRRCLLNTSCNLFRIGGNDISVEECYACGGGYYPHRMTVVRGKNEELPREQGRHNTLYLLDYFANANFPEQPSDIHFKDCVFENIDGVLAYRADSSCIQNGTYLGELTFENIRFTDVKKRSVPVAKREHPLTIVMKNVAFSTVEETERDEAFEILEDSFVTLVKEG